MAEIELKGYTLGQKHQHHNRLVQDAVKSNRTVDVKDFNIDSGDIINLINIDVATRQKNVEYILKVFTCEDMLYASRAIGRSNWLISDQTYAHIINPTYLNTNIFPQMTSKTILKLIKHIRNNLNDEKRAEEFYSYEENTKEAVKWLPYCSSEFIQDKVTNHVQHLKTSLLKRLCEKSVTVLEIYIKSDGGSEKRMALQSNMFLLLTNTDKYLDLVETVLSYEYPNFNKRATKFLMKNNSNRIINKFEKYHNHIHLPTFIKCLKQENIKDFLIGQAQNIKPTQIYRYLNLKHLMLFIKSIPQEIRFDFVKLVFIDIHFKPEKKVLSEKERKALYKIACEYRYSEYIWYQFAPYDVAFQKFKETIRTATSVYEKTEMLKVLLKSAQHNLVHERAFLEYLRDKYSNTDNNIKEALFKNILSNYNILKYDSSTWNVLDDIFKSMDVYAESENQQQKIIETIILYKLIHGEKVPEIIEKKFEFNSLMECHKKLNKKDKQMVFMYLYDLITLKLTKCNVTNETEFKEKICILEQFLNLLKDFKKDLNNYPYLISIIKDLIKKKNDCSWTVNMGTLFDINKTWRKIFFEESLVLCPTESALVNGLKHGPSLLEHNKDVVKNILCNDKITFRDVLGKIKIYWSNSIAKNISLMYMEKLNVLGHHKATTKGLSILLPRTDLQDLIKKYAPIETEVTWDKIDEVELSVQQQFAMNMHAARPQPAPETILLFAKGKYLRYALPSLLAIFYNLNRISSRMYIPNLLDAPVSLQKHGIRLAIAKLEIEDVFHSFSNIWNNNRNASIRSVMFKTMHSLLCKEKDQRKIQVIWDLMEMFIDNLTFQEDKSIYKLLFKVKKVPLSVRGRFYMKCYNFLHNFLKDSGSEYEDYKNKFHSKFAAYSVNIMEQLHPNFVPDIIFEFVDKEFTKTSVTWSHDGIVNLISCYLLDSPMEKIQMEKYEKILLPILKQCFTLWSVVDHGKYFVRYNLTSLLNKLRYGTRQCYKDNKKIIPCKMFSIIQKELEHSLPASENYILLTKWKLTVSFVVILAAQEPMLDWEETCMRVAVNFGDKCNDYLSEDCDKYYPSIYSLFTKALKSMLDDFVAETSHLNVYKRLVDRENFIQGYLATIKLLPKYPRAKNVQQEEEIRNLLKIISKHSVTEIKMHFYNRFRKKASEIDINIDD